MKRAKKLVVGNWKMFPEKLNDAKKIVVDVKRAMSKVKRTNVVLCPPYIYIPQFSGIKKGLLALGSQNTNDQNFGSLTGEVSVSQIEQFNVDYVIVGHSERRKMGETDELVNKKVRSIINYGMTAIVCVGETIRDHNGEYLDLIKQQIFYALKGVEKKYAFNIVIAYEPIWAIGARDAMEPRDVHEMSIYIRKVLTDIFSDYALNVLVLYGGAVDHINAESLIKDGNVAGFLIGRQSLVSKDFIEIIKTVDNA